MLKKKENYLRLARNEKGQREREREGDRERERKLIRVNFRR